MLSLQRFITAYSLLSNLNTPLQDKQTHAKPNQTPKHTTSRTNIFSIPFQLYNVQNSDFCPYLMMRKLITRKETLEGFLLCY